MIERLNVITNLILPSRKKRSNSLKLIILDEADSITNQDSKYYQILWMNLKKKLK